VNRPFNRITNLGAWVNEPYVQRTVIEALRLATWPMTLREIAEAANVPLRPANRVLHRLYNKGLIQRSKLPMQRHAFCRKSWECIPHAAKRMLYVYSWTQANSPEATQPE
jgi:predicted transcriptional regulator